MTGGNLHKINVQTDGPWPKDCRLPTQFTVGAMLHNLLYSHLHISVASDVQSLNIVKQEHRNFCLYLQNYYNGAVSPRLSRSDSSDSDPTWVVAPGSE